MTIPKFLQTTFETQETINIYQIMNFKKYYSNQARNENIPGFRGSNYQKSFGFGDVFKKFFSWIIPIVKKNASPVIKTCTKLCYKNCITYC